jgi:hypothetical protein
MPSIAENRLPSFQQFVISGLPVSQYRRDLEARLNREGERSFVLKPDVYAVILRREGQFHLGNDLAFDLREVENAPVGNFLSLTGAGNFMVSHVASHTGDLVRAAFVFTHGCGSLPLYLGCHGTHGMKSKLGHYPAVSAVVLCKHPWGQSDQPKNCQQR